MTTVTPRKENPTVKLVTLDNAFKLAKSWVNNMSESATDEFDEVEFVGRQPGVGLGARVVPQSRIGASVDSVERRLRAKLDAGKRRAAKNLEESNPTEKSIGHSEDAENSDDEPESRSKAFTKKRVNPMPPISNTNKKHK